jgi:hypothetical protein
MVRKYTWKRDYNYGNRKVHLPQISMGACKNSKPYFTKGGRKGVKICPNINVELGNGYCVTCWDIKSSRKTIV